MTPLRAFLLVWTTLCPFILFAVVLLVRGTLFDAAITAGVGGIFQLWLSHEVMGLAQKGQPQN